MDRLSPSPAEPPPTPQGDPCWHVLDIADGEYPRLLSGDLLDVTIRLQEILRDAKPDHLVYVFYGLRAQISKPPFRYLMWPGGQCRTPLFDVPGEDAEVDLEVDDSDQLGPAYPVLVGLPGPADDIEEASAELEPPPDDDPASEWELQDDEEA